MYAYLVLHVSKKMGPILTIAMVIFFHAKTLFNGWLVNGWCGGCRNYGHVLATNVCQLFSNSGTLTRPFQCVLYHFWRTIVQKGKHTSLHTPRGSKELRTCLESFLRCLSPWSVDGIPLCGPGYHLWICMFHCSLSAFQTRLFSDVHDPILAVGIPIVNWCLLGMCDDWEDLLKMAFTSNLSLLLPHF